MVSQSQISYTFEPTAEKRRYRNYRKEELCRMTTMQLIDICEREEIIHAAVDRLDSAELMHLILQFRGSRTPYLIRKEVEGGKERLETALLKTKKREIHHKISIPGKLVAYHGLDTNYFDSFTLPFASDINSVNAVIIGGNNMARNNPDAGRVLFGKIKNVYTIAAAMPVQSGARAHTTDPWLAERLFWEELLAKNLTKEQQLKELSKFYGGDLSSELISQLEGLYGSLDHGTNKGSYSDFLYAMGIHESQGNYAQPPNPWHFMGKYQIGYEALTDIGVVKEPTWGKTPEGRNAYIGATWNKNKWGVSSESEFLSNKNNCQEDIKESLDRKNWSYFSYYGGEEYIGKTINGVVITESGVLASSALVGAVGLAKAMKNGTIGTSKDAF